MRAPERGHEALVDLQYEFLHARLEVRQERGVKELVAHALLAPYRERAALVEVGGGERGDRIGPRHGDGRHGAIACLVQLPSRLELALGEVREGEVVCGARVARVGGESAPIE